MARRVHSIQEATLPELPPEERDRLYWDELRRMTFGAVRLRGNELKLFGVVTLMRFGDLVGDRRTIEGGLLVGEPGGTIAFEYEQGTLRVAVREFAPSLPRPLYVLQSFVHVRLSKRYFARIASIR